MTVLKSAPDITSVIFKWLDVLTLPFVSHILESGDDTNLGLLGIANNDQKYFVKSITGLEPPDHDIAIAASASGGKFQGMTTEDREVVVLIGLNPDYDAGETPKMLRNNLYTMINSGYNPRVDIQLVSGLFMVAHEYGYVSKFEASLFDADPAVQITFTMLNPTFRAFDPVSYDSLKLSEKHPNIYNSGTAETGFQFAIKFTDTMNGWYIRQAEDQNIGMYFDMTFNDGDILAVSTVPGQKYVHWNAHRKKVKNKLGILKGDSEWIQLHPGSNHFVVPNKSTKWDWKGKLTFTPQYWGV